MTASSHDDLTLSPEDLEFLIAYLRTNAIPVSTQDLLDALRSRMA